MGERQDDDPAAAVQTVPAPPRHVGAVLRRAREGLGEDIRLSASYLKIRESYLRAIEDGRFDDLPGHAYAIGFVRAYAVHLNLDGEKIVQRFKEEAAGGVDPKPDLVIPVPPTESRRPGAIMVLTSLILAVGAYGGWYYLSTQGRLVTEQPSIDLPAKPLAVAELPPARPASVAPAPSAPPTATAGAGASSPAPSPAQTPPTPKPSAAPSVTAAPLPALAAAPAPRPSSALVEPPGAQDADDTETADVPPEPEPLSQFARGMVLQGTPAGTAFDPKTQDTMARPPLSASASAANAATIDSAPVKDAGSAGPSRVTLHAIADSWLQIGDGRGPAIFAQVLRAGESYQVPNRQGLKFDTGNAGGLEITVDGKTVPPVGPSGSVRRNISLDADKLLAGAFGQR